MYVISVWLTTILITYYVDFTLLFNTVHKEFCTLLYLDQVGIKSYKLCLYEYFFGGLEIIHL